MQRIWMVSIVLMAMGLILLTSDQSQANLLAKLIVEKDVGPYHDSETIDNSVSTLRISGNTRYETSRMISETFNDGLVENVVLLSGQDIGGSISASPLAAQLQAPIILCEESYSASIECIEYVTSHLDKQGTIYIIGNEDQLSLDFETNLKDYKVVRLGGLSSNHTSLLVAQEIQAPEGTPVFLVGGQSSAAISVSSIAGIKGYPIISIDREIGIETQSFLLDLKPHTIYIVDSNQTIPLALQKEIERLLPGIEIQRITGEDIFETAINVTREFFQNPKELFIVSGTNFIDAISGTVLATQEQSPIILLDPEKIEPPLAVDLYLQELYIGGHQPYLTVLGGNRVLSNTLLANIQDIIYAGYETEQLKSYKMHLVDEDCPIVPPKSNIKETLVISAIGDCTLGTDPRYGYQGSLPQAYDQNGPGYFFSGVVNILEQDDLTIANLENVLTKEVTKADKSYQTKPFWFSGDPSYTDILAKGSIEAVCLANNHSRDFRDKGFNDTVDALMNSNIAYFGNNNHAVIEKKGVRIGLLGFNLIGLNPYPSMKQIKDDIALAIEDMKNQSDFLIVSFHWGTENNYGVTSTQKDLAYFTIENGADLILGHHSHVLGLIENYKGKYIVYSLGNFVFGGNFNPQDKDTVIFQQSIEIVNGEYWIPLQPEVIPCKISSVNYKNDYKPVPAPSSDHTDYERVLSKLSWDRYLE